MFRNRYRYDYLKHLSVVAQSHLIMPITDEEAALQAIAALNELSAQQQGALCAITALIGNGEPFVNIHELFSYYDKLYFRNLLVPRVEVIWSPRLTL